MENLAQHFPNELEIFHVDNNLGAHRGKQYLMEHTTRVGDWVAVMDNDIEVFPDWDQPIREWLGSHPEAGVVGVQGYFLDYSTEVRRVIPAYANVDPLPVDILTGFVMISQTSVLKTLRYKDPGIFETNWFDDDDWCIQIAHAGFINYVFPRVKIIHHGSQSSKLVPQDPLNEQPPAIAERLQRFWRAEGFVNSDGTLTARHGTPPSKSIVLEGPMLQSHSLATVNRNLMASLAPHTGNSTNVCWVPVDSNDEAPYHYRVGFDISWHRQTLPIERSVTIRHHYPPRWRDGDGPLITIQPWEYGAIPEDWVTGLNRSDQVWVPSTRVQRIYQDEGITNVSIIPNGIDPTLYHSGGPRLFEDDGVFRFLFVGGLIHRKGIDTLLKAYRLAFKPTDPVELMIRDFGTGTVYARTPISLELDEWATRSDLPRIRRVRAELSESQMPALYRSANVVVQPFRAEGFCLPALEAMASGTPVIVTRHGGADDFVTEEVGWFIDSAEQSLPLELTGLPHSIGKMATFQEPNIASLIIHLRWCFDHPEQVRNKGVLAAIQALHWTWDNAAHIAFQRLSEFL